MVEESVSERIRFVLKDLGIKQSFLASKIGISPEGLSRMLKMGNIEKNKYLSKIASALDVTEYYLLTGNDKPVLLVHDEQLKRLIKENFTLLDEEKLQLKDFMVESNESDIFFAYRLKISIDTNYQVGSLVIFCPEIPKEKISGEIYMLLSNISQSFVVGKFSQDKKNIINLNGHYPIMPNDQFVGHATQIVLFL